MKIKEKWTPIPDFDGYFITDDWRCYSTKKNDYIGSESVDGYTHLSLSNIGNYKNTSLHAIIAEMFVPIPDRYKDVPREEMIVHHIDHNSHNNDPSNLQWMTKSEHNELHRNSDMTRKRRSNNNDKFWYGKHLSEEHRKKLSEAKKGNNNRSKGILQIDIETGRIIGIFPSATDASIKLNICKSNISSCCNGKRNNAGGYGWAYLN